MNDDKDIIVPGFDNLNLGDMDFSADIPDVLNEAADVSNLPSTPIRYADSDSSGSSLRAYEESTYAPREAVAQPMRETIHTYFERESRDKAPTISMEQHGWQESSWADASAKTAERMNEAQTSVYGGMGGVLSVFNTRPGEIPEEQNIEAIPEDEITEAVISYIKTYYAEQLKKLEAGFERKLGRAVSEKVRKKILPNFFQKRTGDGAPKKAETPKPPKDPNKFDFKKFVATDF